MTKNVRMKLVAHNASLARWLKGAAACIGAVGMAGAAIAQETGQDQAKSATNATEEPGDIVVTANKLGSNLDRAPVSSTVVTAAKLAATHVETVQGVQARVPSLVYTTNVGYAQAYIRGVGAKYSIGGLESPVATYVDGVYQQRQGGAIVGVVDLSDVTVLKGPQSTLYGRNATAGAILVQTANPTDKLEGHVVAEYGRFDQVKFQAVVNAPLSDTISVRLAGQISDRNGYLDNIVDGSRLGRVRSKMFRLKIAWHPTNNLSVLLTTEGQRFNGDYGERQLLSGASCLGCVLYGVTPPAGFYTVALNVPGIIKNNYISQSIQIQYDKENFSLTSISAYRYANFNSYGDQDVTAGHAEDGGTSNKGPTFTSDTYVKTKFDSPINFLIGGSFEHDKAIVGIKLVGDLFGPLSPVVNTDTSKLTSWSAYAEGYLKLADHVTVTVGGRYNIDRKRYFTVNGPGAAALVGGLVSFGGRKTFRDFTPRAVIAYDGDAGYYYASASRGAKSGGFAQPGLTPIDPLKSERLTNFEIGAKNKFLDGRLRTSIALFAGKYSNIAVTINKLTGIFSQNAGSARLRGIEFDAQVDPAHGLNISAGGAFLDNKYTRYADAALYNVDPTTGALSQVAVDLKGTRLTNSPKFSGYVSGDYRTEIANDWSLHGSVVARYTGKYFFQAGGGSTLGLAQQKSYTKVDMTAGVTSPGGRYDLSLYVDNLTGAKYYNNLAFSNFGASGEPSPQRSLGVRFSANFQ